MSTETPVLDRRTCCIVKAAEVLHLTPQTISGQLKLLEEAIGEPLFDRVGRRLVLTEKGQVVLQYADEIAQIREQENGT